MHWIVASLVSAFFLGCYDLCTKQAVRGNAVLPVLFLANVCSASVWCTLMAVIASLRRASILIAFAGGFLFFGEINGRKKLPAVAGVLLGVVLTVLG